MCVCIVPHLSFCETKQNDEQKKTLAHFSIEIQQCLLEMECHQCTNRVYSSLLYTLAIIYISCIKSAHTHIKRKRERKRKKETRFLWKSTHIFNIKWTIAIRAECAAHTNYFPISNFHCVFNRFFALCLCRMYVHKPQCIDTGKSSVEKNGWQR